MSVWILMPVLLGAAILTQGLMNRGLATEMGLGLAVLINSAVVLAAALIVMIIAWTQILPLPSWLQSVASPVGWRWGFLVSGLCGFFIVLGIPLALEKIGPSKTFVILVGAQIVLGVLADRWLFDQSLSWNKIVGASLTVLGAVLVAW